MAKRIFRSVVLTAVLAVLLTAAIIVSSLYTVYENRLSQELRQEAEYIVHALEMAEDDIAYLNMLNTDSRITLLALDGQVLYDSAADSARMENHATRPEIVEAIAEGVGESTRTSDTLSETTIYYALRCGEDFVLRMANTRSSMLGTFLNVLPLIAAMLLCVVLMSLWIAKRTAKRIVAPINELNLDEPLENDAYDELAPLLTRMNQQCTQIRRHVKATENARAELSAIMENMREGMILLDNKEGVLSMNESASRIFDVHADTVIGQNLLSVNRDADLHDLVQSALRGEGDSMNMERNGRHYRVYGSPVLKRETVRGAVLLILDVTEQYAAEESRREFTANVSHELKTPLTSISGFAEIIRDGIAKPEDIQHFAGMICKESTRLMTLVNDILELSHLDEKQNLGQKENVELKGMLQNLIDDFTVPSMKKKQTLSLMGNEGNFVVEGYPLLLREMFFNLIDNAIKYTPEGGEVKIALNKESGQVVCRVSDNGVGISKEHQPHVFERFYRVDKSHSRATGGTGLGLAIVKHVAQIHKAELELISEEKIGTSVVLKFR